MPSTDTYAQSLIADYLRENLSSLTREEVDTFTSRFHEQQLSDASFSQHVSVYVIDAVFDTKNTQVTSYLTDMFSSHFRLYTNVDPAVFDTSKRLLMYRYRPSLHDSEDIEYIDDVAVKKQASHFYAAYASELLWSACVLESNSLFFDTSKLVSQAQQAFQKAARFDDPVYTSLAGDTKRYANNLSAKKDRYFS